MRKLVYIKPQGMRRFYPIDARLERVQVRNAYLFEQVKAEILQAHFNSLGMLCRLEKWAGDRGRN